MDLFRPREWGGIPHSTRRTTAARAWPFDLDNTRRFSATCLPDLIGFFSCPSSLVAAFATLVRRAVMVVSLLATRKFGGKRFLRTVLTPSLFPSATKACRVWCVDFVTKNAAAMARGGGESEKWFLQKDTGPRAQVLFLTSCKSIVSSALHLLQSGSESFLNLYAIKD